MWWQKYLSVPFEPDESSMKSCDCAGLVFLVLENELGIKIPRSESTKFSARRKQEIFESYRNIIEEVRKENIKPFDFFFQLSGAVFHTGIVVGENHVLETTMQDGVKLRKIEYTLMKPTKFYRVKK